MTGCVAAATVVSLAPNVTARAACSSVLARAGAAKAGRRVGITMLIGEAEGSDLRAHDEHAHTRAHTGDQTSTVPLVQPGQPDSLDSAAASPFPPRCRSVSRQWIAAESIRCGLRERRLAWSGPAQLASVAIPEIVSAQPDGRRSAGAQLRRKRGDSAKGEGLMEQRAGRNMRLAAQHGARIGVTEGGRAGGGGRGRRGGGASMWRAKAACARSRSASKRPLLL